MKLRRTSGRSIPNGGGGCLCAKSNTYSPECCGKSLLNQGLGDLGTSKQVVDTSRYNDFGIYIGPTKGKNVPLHNGRGCLCLDSERYDVKCCKGYLMNQGVGNVYGGTTKRTGGFSNGFSSGFDSKT
jgi:hypothetical protein